MARYGSVSADFEALQSKTAEKVRRLSMRTEAGE
jgi:hypothetical protein